MGEIGLNMESGVDATIISNSFIENFMADANGSYVKVYLYLLYLVQKNLPFSSEAACDFLGDTEKDVMRAIDYWEKAGLLSTKKEGKALSSLTLLSPSVAKESTEIAHFVMKATKVGTITELTPNIPVEKQNSSCREENEDDFKLIMSVAEKYMERILSSADYNLICDLYEKMGFSTELILHLFEYCAEKGKTDYKYIEKVALHWADEGIRTVEQAMEYSIKYNQNYNSVIKAFGLNRTLGEAEMKFINQWLYAYHMPLDLMIEACNRTLLQLGKPDFKYADKILSNWNEHACHNLSAVRTLDEVHTAARLASKSKANEGNTKMKLHSFPQRAYSDETFDDLEKKLLKNN